MSLVPVGTSLVPCARCMKRVENTNCYWDYSLLPHGPVYAVCWPCFREDVAAGRFTVSARGY